jgi:hypothetical protein
VKQTFALAVCVLLVAAILRIVHLSTLPPGPHFDEAANVLITRSIANGADLFPIANSYQGRESLYFYLSQPIFRFVDDGVFGLQIVSVFSNLLTVAATMTLGRLMIGGRRGMWVGLVAGALMAISFHQIFMSRQAYRAVTLPLMQALGLLFLWRGLSGNKLWWVTLGGALCAGALYTYMASRLFPVWLGGAALFLLWLDHRRVRLTQGTVFGLAFALAAVPMTFYALQNPDIFLQRLTEVSGGEVTVSLGESVRRHLEMFFIRGDFGNLRYNDPGRPYFTLFEAPFLFIGAFIALGMLWRNKQGALVRVAALLLVLSPLMIIPSVISVAGFPPSHMRSLGMVPLIFLLGALGIVWSVERLRLRPVHQRGAFLLLMAWGAVSVYGAYTQWANRADLFYQADGDLAAAADWLSQTVTDEHVYVASFNPQHTTVITRYGDDVTWLGLSSLFFPPPDETGLVIFPHQNPPPEDWFALLEPGWVQDVPAGPDGDLAFWAFRVEAQAAQADGATNDYVQMGQAEGVIASGEQGTLTLTWDVLQTPPYARLRPIVTVLDTLGQTLAFSDLFLLGTDQWRAGEKVFQRVRVDVPAGIPPGSYPVIVAWVDRDSEQLIPYTSGAIREQVGALTVKRPVRPAADMAIAIPDAQNVTSGMRYLGYNGLPDAALRPGEPLSITTYWAATQADRIAQTVTLWLDDRALDAQDFPFASTRWQDGDVFRMPFRWSLPRDVGSGTYMVRLQVAETTLDLGTITIDGVPRQMTAPDVETVVNVNYGGLVALYGYTVQQTEAGVEVRLVWQALEEMTTDYTVFVHMLDASGVTVDQRDAMPQNYAYPTSLWTPGEYITDVYNFSHGFLMEFTFRVGLYNQVTGDRLQVSAYNTQIEYADYYVILMNSSSR